jgi:hypothetical protein
MNLRNEQIDQIIAEVVRADLSQDELDRRIQSIKSSLGILEQLKKMPGIPKVSDVFTLRSIARDALGIRGEEVKL